MAWSQNLELLIISSTP